MMVARRSEYDGISVAGSVLGILLGGLLAMYLAGRTTAGQDIIWWYPIGMLAALVLVGGVTSVKGAVTYVKDAKIRAKRSNKTGQQATPADDHKRPGEVDAPSRSGRCDVGSRTARSSTANPHPARSGHTDPYGSPSAVLARVQVVPSHHR